MDRRAEEVAIFTVEEVLMRLRAKARPDHIEGMASYGMAPEQRLGVAVPEMRKIARQIGKDHGLALALWETGIAEAKMLASMIDDPTRVSEAQMDQWVDGFNSWDVCDQVCMNLFEKTPLAWQKALDWSTREEEFVKRAAYALIACLAWHDKEAADGDFLELLPVIRRGATDGRNYVKKAVSWALRNIGKRNWRLNEAALQTAQAIGEIDSRPARWIAADAIRDLTSDATRRRLAKRRG